MNEAKQICDEHDLLMDARGLPSYDQLRAVNAELVEALQYLIQGKPGEAQFDRLYDVRVTAARAALLKAQGEK